MKNYVFKTDSSFSANKGVSNRVNILLGSLLKAGFDMQKELEEIL